MGTSGWVVGCVWQYRGEEGKLNSYERANYKTNTQAFIIITTVQMTS